MVCPASLPAAATQLNRLASPIASHHPRSQPASKPAQPLSAPLFASHLSQRTSRYVLSTAQRTSRTASLSIQTSRARHYETLTAAASFIALHSTACSRRSYSAPSSSTAPFADTCRASAALAAASFAFGAVLSGSVALRVCRRLHSPRAFPSAVALSPLSLTHRFSSTALRRSLLPSSFPLWLSLTAD